MFAESVAFSSRVSLLSVRVNINFIERCWKWLVIDANIETNWLQGNSFVGVTDYEILCSKTTFQ